MNAKLVAALTIVFAVAIDQTCAQRRKLAFAFGARATSCLISAFALTDKVGQGNFAFEEGYKRSI